MAMLITGGAGLIGSNFIRHVLTEHPDTPIVNLDMLTYTGNPESLRDVAENPNYTFVKGDICDPETVAAIFARHPFDTVVHFAAESYVDRSITDGSAFVRTNVLGIFTLLDCAQKHGIQWFVHVLTDEVYESTSDGSFVETDNLNPSSPYSSSKASSDLLARSFFITHGLLVIVTQCTNNYGPYQFPEKLIPFFATNLLEGKKVPVYSIGENVRDWLYVLDHRRAIDFILQHGEPEEVYNISGGAEKTALKITERILKLLGKDESMIEYAPDRKGHDFRYSLDFGKLRALGWKPIYTFGDALAATIVWYVENGWWWRPLVKK